MKVIKDGSHFSMSRYDEETETWKLNSLDESVSGTSPASIASMGTGLQSWQFDKYLKFIYGHHIMVTPFFLVWALVFNLSSTVFYIEKIVTV